MKRMIILVLAVSMMSAASAQSRGHGRGVVMVSPRIIITGMPYYGIGYPYYGLSPYGYNYYQQQRFYRPSKLDVKIQTIRHDYDQKIASVKMDKSLSRRDRRQQIKALKKERDYQVDEARRGYYKN